MKFLFFFSLMLFLPFVAAASCEENQQRQCGMTSAGACSYGFQVCEGGQWSVCYGHIDPVPEVCNNGVDDDCNGETDEGCLCVAGEQRQCEGNTKGICRPGYQTCVNGTAWSSCFNVTAPLINELCDNKQDDDCDGQVDEGCGQQNQTSQQTTPCFNGVQDGDETGVDCGGSCRTCVSCTDGILNQGEWKVKVDVGNGTVSDCGGSSCPGCPTCFDGVKNQGELDVDCGGSCRTCDLNQTDADEDKDGLVLSVEERKGTDPFLADTDGDGADDRQDKYPLCPNTACDVDYGENERNCPEDCKQATVASLGGVLLIVFVLFVSIGLYLWYQFKRGIKKTASPETKKPFQELVYISKELLNKRPSAEKSKIDKELEQSFQKVEKMLK